ncbi:MAG: RNA methyltransferase, partial [Atopobiaceae bacterium]|nr:RNA methyltransferase [Atopobiaceae bacterium]
AYIRLTDHELRNRLEPEKGVCVVESEIAIRVAMECGLSFESLLVSAHRLEHMQGIIEEVTSVEPIPVYVLPIEETERLTGYRLTRGVLAIVKRPRNDSIEDLLDGTLLGSSMRVALLEGLTDTSNVGTVFRTAAALGVDAIVVAPDCADPLNRRSIRTSMGNVFRIPWICVDSLHDAILSMKDAGFTVIALALAEDAVPLSDPKLKSFERVVLMLGSEGDGLSTAALDEADMKAIIPMSRGTDSLNVGAAAAIAFWELRHS